MQLNTLKRHHSHKSSRRVGRGGKRGKTAGRGTKGAGARAGNRGRPEMRDIIKKLPKRRGFGKNRARTVNNERVTTAPVNLRDLEVSFDSGAEVTPETLRSKGLVSRVRGSFPPVKILGAGTLTKKLSISGCQVSASAKTAIEKAGGSIA